MELLVGQATRLALVLVMVLFSHLASALAPSLGRGPGVAQSQGTALEAVVPSGLGGVFGGFLGGLSPRQGGGGAPDVRRLASLSTHGVAALRWASSDVEAREATAPIVGAFEALRDGQPEALVPELEPPPPGTTLGTQHRFHCYAAGTTRAMRWLYAADATSLDLFRPLAARFQAGPHTRGCFNGTSTSRVFEPDHTCVTRNAFAARDLGRDAIAPREESWGGRPLERDSEDTL